MLFQFPKIRHNENSSVVKLLPCDGFDFAINVSPELSNTRRHWSASLYFTTTKKLMLHAL